MSSIIVACLVLKLPKVRDVNILWDEPGIVLRDQAWAIPPRTLVLGKNLASISPELRKVHLTFCRRTREDGVSLCVQTCSVYDFITTSYEGF